GDGLSLRGNGRAAGRRFGLAWPRRASLAVGLDARASQQRALGDHEQVITSQGEPRPRLDGAISPLELEEVELLELLEQALDVRGVLAEPAPQLGGGESLGARRTEERHVL